MQVVHFVLMKPGGREVCELTACSASAARTRVHKVWSLLAGSSQLLNSSFSKG